jgi:hypothetical protein
VSAHSGAVEAVDRILNRGGRPEDVLREVVAVLHERVFAWAGLVFDDGTARPEAGERPAAPALAAPVLWQGRRIARLEAQPRSGQPDADERALLDRVALLISAVAASA